MNTIFTYLREFRCAFSLENFAVRAIEQQKHAHIAQNNFPLFLEMNIGIRQRGIEREQGSYIR